MSVGTGGNKPDVKIDEGDGEIEMALHVPSPSVDVPVELDVGVAVVAELGELGTFDLALAASGCVGVVADDPVFCAAVTPVVLWVPPPCDDPQPELRAKAATTSKGPSPARRDEIRVPHVIFSSTMFDFSL